MYLTLIKACDVNISFIYKVTNLFMLINRNSKINFS